MVNSIKFVNGNMYLLTIITNKTFIIQVLKGHDG